MSESRTIYLLAAIVAQAIRQNRVNELAHHIATNHPVNDDVASHLLAEQIIDGDENVQLVLDSWAQQVRIPCLVAVVAGSEEMADDVVARIAAQQCADYVGNYFGAAIYREAGLDAIEAEVVPGVVADFLAEREAQASGAVTENEPSVVDESQPTAADEEPLAVDADKSKV